MFLLKKTEYTIEYSSKNEESVQVFFVLSCYPQRVHIVTNNNKLNALGVFSTRDKKNKKYIYKRSFHIGKNTHPNALKYSI